MRKITRALISVSDKAGVVEFAAGLAELGVEILLTGGTAKLLRESGLKVRDVSEVTGFPEMLDGRVKTLHPKVHGGILAIRSNPEHQKAVAAHGIGFIDLVAVNLYPFEKTAAKPGVTLEELIENIDIGGPSMIRSAAKNFHDVTVVVDAADFSAVLSELRANQGSISRETRARLSRKAFATTAAYDGAISTTLQRWAEGAALPERLHLNYRKTWICATARTLTSGRRFTWTPPRGGVAWPRRANSRAKNFRSITSWTWRRPGDWCGNLTSPPPSLSSTRILAEWAPLRRLRKATSARSTWTRSPPLVRHRS